MSIYVFTCPLVSRIPIPNKVIVRDSTVYLESTHIINMKLIM